MLTCTEAMERRIETTKMTSEETFAEIDSYIKAANCIIDPNNSYDLSNKRFILALQIVALKLMQEAPGLVEEALIEVDNHLNEE